MVLRDFANDLLTRTPDAAEQPWTRTHRGRSMSPGRRRTQTLMNDLDRLRIRRSAVPPAWPSVGSPRPVTVAQRPRTGLTSVTATPPLTPTCTHGDQRSSSKLVMPVRSRSPALQMKSRSGWWGSPPGVSRCRRTSHVPCLLHARLRQRAGRRVSHPAHGCRRGCPDDSAES